MKSCHGKGNLHCEYTRALKELFTQTSVDQLDQAVEFANSMKHTLEMGADLSGKQQSYDFRPVLRKVGNTLLNALKTRKVGFFEGVEKRKFSSSFHGRFAEVKGPSRNFYSTFAYQGNASFSSECLYLVDLESGTAISLFPLMVMGLEEIAGAPHFYMYDSMKKDAAVYRTIEAGQTISVSANGELAELWESVQSLGVEDQFERMDDIKLSKLD